MWERRYPKEDSPAMYEELTLEEKARLADWIAEKLTLRKTANFNHSSYGLKHLFEHDTGLYVYNGAFKGAMQAAGYMAVDPKEQNWHYKIKYCAK